MNSRDPAAARLARFHLIFAGCFLLVVAGTVLPVSFAARSKNFTAWIAREDEAYYRKTRGLHASFSGYLVRYPDHFVYDELPAADFSRGGVYLTGPSNMGLGTKLWELPPEQEAFIHNCGLDANTHSGEFATLRYMIEQRGMLAAGGSKSLVVIGACYHSAGGIGSDRELPPSFRSAWNSHGFYQCNRAGGIVPREVSPLAKFIHGEKLRMAACLSRLMRWARHKVLSPKQRVHDMAMYVRNREQFMGPGWRDKVADQTGVFARMLDYLRGHGVQVLVVLPPMGSWEKEMPYAAHYNTEITAICAQKGVPVKDWTALVSDEEFWDSSHMNLEGVEKFQAALLNEVALPFMRSVVPVP